MKDNEIKIIRTACPAHCGVDACGILAYNVDDIRLAISQVCQFDGDIDGQFMAPGPVAEPILVMRDARSADCERSVGAICHRIGLAVAARRGSGAAASPMARL